MTVNPPPKLARAAERREKYHEADVVVVGAGIFGCAAAFALANQGRSVILLERWMHEPDRIVGELLQPGGVAALKKLGLGHCLEGIDSIPCYGYHVLWHGDDAVIPYPAVDKSGKVLAKIQQTGGLANGLVNGHADVHANGHVNGTANGHSEKQYTHQGSQGRGFHHGRFIMQLRKACQEHSNITVFESDVTATITGEHGPEVLGVEARTLNAATGQKERDYFFGQLTIIADGYASKFRKQLLGTTPRVKSKFYALELIDCPFPPQGFGHVVIGNAFPVLLYQIGTHETRALIDVPEKIPEAAPAAGGVRNYIERVVVPSLPKHVQPSFKAALADGKIPRSMPNSWLPATPQTQHAGVLVLGDALNMRHPLTGGGMTVAFNDVILLSSLLAPEKIPDLGNYKAVHKAMRKFHGQRKSLTSIINVLAQALYSLFAASDKPLKALQRGCFKYFEYGITDEPMGLMGGLIHRPTNLAYHFFSVAFLAVWLNAQDVVQGPDGKGGILGLVKAPLAVWEGVVIIWTACVVFLPVLWQEI
jgi:squalene monooxygenase